MNWRLIEDGAYTGAWNMARDEALLNSADAVTPPVLRFYNWNPACISIGRLQKGFATASNFDVVRRPTGGRAVLHQHEITYCAVLHRDYLPRESRSVLGAYHWLSQGFIAGLQTLGVQAELATRSAARAVPSAANCFQSAAQCDFVVEGRKLIGASQCRKNDVILQHGSILLEVDQNAWYEAIGGAMRGAVSLRELGVRQEPGVIVRALCEGMQSRWQVAFESSELSASETQRSEVLYAQKYFIPAWNENGIDKA